MPSSKIRISGVSMKDKRRLCSLLWSAIRPSYLNCKLFQLHKKWIQPKGSRDLALLAHDLSKKNIPVVISNHDTVYTRNIYSLAKINNFDVQKIHCQQSSQQNKSSRACCNIWIKTYYYAARQIAYQDLNFGCHYANDSAGKSSRLAFSDKKGIYLYQGDAFSLMLSIWKSIQMDVSIWFLPTRHTFFQMGD